MPDDIQAARRGIRRFAMKTARQFHQMKRLAALAFVLALAAGPLVALDNVRTIDYPDATTTVVKHQ